MFRLFISFQFWASYASCSSQYADAVQIFLEQIDVIKRLTEEYPDDMVFITDADGEGGFSHETYQRFSSIL